jgi:hypothetical protein
MSIKEDVGRTTGGDMILDAVEDNEEVIKEVLAVVVMVVLVLELGLELELELALICSRKEGVVEEEETVVSTWFPSQMVMV